MEYLSGPETPIAPPPVRRSRGLPRWLLLGGAIFVVGVAAIAMLLRLGFDLGPRGLTVGIAAAVLPVPFLVACFLWLDRYEPEPRLLLLLTFGWGAFGATFIAYTVNRFFADTIGMQDNLVGVLIAPCVEESMKALGPLLILWLRPRQISGITDGIVYCGLSAVGFAMVENILYLGGHAFNAGYEQYGPASGTALVFGLFIARIFMSGFAHPLFTSMTGIGIGLGARSASGVVRALAPIPGLILAMMLHGSWNLMAILSASRSPYIFLYGYIAVMVPVFLTMVGIALWVRSHEGGLALKMLPPYSAAGWFTPPEIAALGTLGRRHAARVWAKRVAGDPGRQAMKDFQFAATRLALVRDSAHRGLDSPDRLRDEEQSLLKDMMDARRFFAGRDPQMPPARWDGQSYELTVPDGARRKVMAPPEPVVPLPIPLLPAAPPG
jgi:RsiW-degrading membrane proteinase PrsW (M82 family)